VTLVHGTVAAGYEPVYDYLASESQRDHDYEFQLAVYRGSDLVVDIWGGSALTADSLMIPASVSKNTIGFTIALLVDRGELDLDATVAHYWPEFAAEGKSGVTVRQLLSHQAGLPETSPRLTDADYADLGVAAGRLAAQLPWWRPGAAFGYHGLTIAPLAAELVRRITGRPFHEFFESEIRSARGLDFYVGLPEALEARVVETLPMIVPADVPRDVPFVRTPGQIGREVFAGLAVQRTPEEAAVWSRRQRTLGNPAAFATASARGIAGLFAEAVVGLTGPALVSQSTLERIAQLQVVGTDAVIGIDRGYGIVFQKPTSNLAFGSFRAFGHDGAGGALGFHDPRTGVSFGYAVRRTPFPGGADARAIHAAQLVHGIVDAAGAIR
jgi:CubicO group peptidase (beta-lactamase class C family)